MMINMTRHIKANGTFQWVVYYPGALHRAVFPYEDDAVKFVRVAWPEASIKTSRVNTALV